MSKTRTFKMGDAEVYQDKPSQESKMAIELMHKAEHERCGLLVKKGIKDLAEALADREDSELGTALKLLVRMTKELKRKKDEEK